MTIQLFVTGGTFDKDYDEIKGVLYFNETNVPEMLRLGRCRASVEITTLMMMDSLDMGPRERETILNACRTSAREKIVITHGTDTMVETARYLGEAAIAKTIVLTGAMIPYNFGSSDGMFNLGSALACVELLPAGVWVAMNGRIFPWDNVMKNRRIGEFEMARKESG